MPNYMTFVDDVTGDIVTIMDEFINRVFINGVETGLFARVFPGARLDFYRGIMIDKDGIVHPSTGANIHVAQYDGCHYLEMK